MTTSTTKPIILHLGDPIHYNQDLEKSHFNSSHFTIIRPSTEERSRQTFIQSLKEQKWGQFTAIFRPFWDTGNEMAPWNSELIDLLPSSCKISASAGAGYDWVDTSAMAARGIIYCNGAPACTESVADMALWHIIGCFRSLVWSSTAARSGVPEEWMDAHANVGREARNPKGLVLGIIGLGRIGYRIAEKVRGALGMSVRYFDTVRKDEEMERAVGAEYVSSVESLVAEADCVVLATPLVGDRKIVTRKLLGKFKTGGRFVNIARGKLVDEGALVEALKSGKLSSAGLDVFEDEPNVHPELLGMRNVSLTAHNAGGTVDTKAGFERLAMENILGWLKEGREGLKTAVNLEGLKD